MDRKMKEYDDKLKKQESMIMKSTLPKSEDVSVLGDTRATPKGFLAASEIIDDLRCTSCGQK